jgi:hypothetical protein
VLKPGPLSNGSNSPQADIVQNFRKVIICIKVLTFNLFFELLSDCQFGFRKFHSTATALLDCTNDWYDMNLDRKMFNLVVLIDLKKAFDTVYGPFPN